MHPHRFPLLLLALGVLLASCSDDGSVVDSTLTAPSILLTRLELSATLVDTDSVDVVPGTDKSPDDRISIPIRILAIATGPVPDDAMVCTITLDGKTQRIASAILHPEGNGRFGGVVELDLRRGDVGDYRFELQAMDAAGEASNLAVARLRVVYGSKPPVIVRVIAPDTLTVAQSTIAVDISALVTDPSGPRDIKQVFFNSFLPDGRPSSQNPFILRDDGNPGSGDAVAGDSLYSIRIQLPPDAQKGTYRFEFRALDFSNLASNVVIHRVVVQ